MLSAVYAGVMWRISFSKKCCLWRPTPGLRWAPAARRPPPGTGTPRCGPMPSTGFSSSAATTAAAASVRGLLGCRFLRGKEPPLLTRGNKFNDLYLYSYQVRVGEVGISWINRAVPHLGTQKDDISSAQMRAQHLCCGVFDFSCLDWVK